MTTTISAVFTEPTPTIDIPIEVTADCTAGYAWCNEGECHEQIDVEPGDEDFQDEPMHIGTVAHLPMLRFTADGWRDLGNVTLTIRHDENEGDDSQPLIRFRYPHADSGPAMTAEQARINAAWLLNAADLLDPLPAGAMATYAMHVRIGDELLTEGGWQKVTGLVLEADIELVQAYTPLRSMDGGEGWDFSFNDPVTVRRPVHGSCAIQFVEPIQ